MKRTKRFTLRRIALGLAVAAAFAPAAQAEPIGSYERQSSVEIPYLSHGVGVSHADFDSASPLSGRRSDEIPYLSHGATAAQPVAIAPDDMALSRPVNVGSASVTASSGGFDVGPGTVSGFAVALVLLLGGSAMAIRHRKTRLSPA